MHSDTAHTDANARIKEHHKAKSSPIYSVESFETDEKTTLEYAIGRDSAYRQRLRDIMAHRKNIIYVFSF